MREFSEKISINALAAHIVYEMRENASPYDFRYGINNVSSDIDFLQNGIFHDIKHMSPQVEKDLSEVEFSTENICSDLNNKHFGNGHLCGFHRTEEGMPFLGMIASGDWEHPLFFILYWDGTCIRAYVPVEGNTWNQKTKSAYGNNPESDLQDISEKLGISISLEAISAAECICLINVNFDVEKIFDDISRNIKFVGVV